MGTCKAADKSKKHDICKRVKYRSKLPDERYINPGDEQVTFEHLADVDYLKLCKKGFIKPVATSKATKDG